MVLCMVGHGGYAMEHMAEQKNTNTLDEGAQEQRLAQLAEQMKQGVLQERKQRLARQKQLEAQVKQAQEQRLAQLVKLDEEWRDSDSFDWLSNPESDDFDLLSNSESDDFDWLSNPESDENEGVSAQEVPASWMQMMPKAKESDRE
jgi:hypothetical protein